MADEKDDPESGTSDAASSKGNGRDEEDIHIEVLDPDENPKLELEPSSGTVEDVQELQKQLLELRKEKDEIYDRLLRKHADFENFRKRTEKDKREFQRYALADFMSELVVILDNFERALSHSEDQSGPEYRKGIELIYRQLRDLTEKKGLRAIQTEGQKFDPNYHEAIARELRNDLPDNTILEELQKGYLVHEKLLRPAMVKVSFRSGDDPEDTNEPETTEGESTNSETESDDEWQNSES